MSSPAHRTLMLLRKWGYVAGVVEKWNQHARVRQDLFGFLDIVAMREDVNGTLGIQATSGDHVRDRVNKCVGLPDAKLYVTAGNTLEVWGWKKSKERVSGRLWVVRLVRLCLTNGGGFTFEESRFP